MKTRELWVTCMFVLCTLCAANVSTNTVVYDGKQSTNSSDRKYLSNFSDADPAT